MRKPDAGFFRNAGLIGKAHKPAMPLTPQDYGQHKAMPMIPMREDNPASPVAPKPPKMPKLYQS